MSPSFFKPASKFLLIQAFIYLQLLTLLPHPVRGKDQYVLPLNMGMKCSVAYDIANLFNRYPIQGSLSVVLALAINAILFFGIITAPFGYFMGIPSKKYVLGDVAVHGGDKDILSERSDFIEDEVISRLPTKRSPVYLKPLQRSFPEFHSTHGFDNYVILNATNKENDHSPRSKNGRLDMIWKLFVDYVTKSRKPRTTTLVDEMFSYMPKSGSLRSKGCDLMSVCYAHGALKRLPVWVIQIYHVFSGQLPTISAEFKEAILQGMEDEEKCAIRFSDLCSETLFTIVLKSYLNFLPKEALSMNMPKRKQAMYL